RPSNSPTAACESAAPTSKPGSPPMRSTPPHEHLRGPHLGHQRVQGPCRRKGRRQGPLHLPPPLDGRRPAFRQELQTRALAESFRSKLVVAQREGVAFDEATGLPEPMAREAKSRTWYQHAVAFVDMKWPRASAKQRRSIADALATVTPALLATERGAPDVPTMRAALYGWVFNKAHRDAGPPPDELAPAVRWLAANTVKLTALGTDAALVRKALDALTLRLDGKTAAPNTMARKRAVFYGALRYAVELRLLDTNPIDHVQWTPERSEGVVDRRVVVNPTQARALLAAIREIEPELEAFFACIYYAALRPAEVLHLTVDDCELPEQG